MIHLDEVRPVYQNGGGKPKGKKQNTREDNVAALYRIHLSNADTVASTPENRRRLARHNTLRTIREVGFDGIPRAIATHNYGGHSDNEKPRTYNSDAEYFQKDNYYLRRFYPDAIEAENDTAYVRGLLNGKEGRSYNNVNPNYERDFLRMTTARNMLDKIEDDYILQEAMKLYQQAATADATYVAPPIVPSVRRK